MNQGSRRWRGIAALAGAGLLAVVACTPAADTSDKEVTVVGSWGGSEQESFLAMVKPWEESTGNTIKYTGSRGLGTYLTTAV